jgi:hypothetical protein
LPFDLLHFGSGIQAIHYFVLCFVSIVGTLQGVATRFENSDLIWLPGKSGYWLGGLLVTGSTAWFFLVDEELFIPGLAGGELFVIFATAFIAAVQSTRFLSLLFARMRLLFSVSQTQKEESLP